VVIQNVNVIFISSTSFNTLTKQKDHPNHKTAILAGLWGFKTVQNRQLGFYIFDRMTNERMRKWYKNYRNIKESDQIFLKEYLWDIIKTNVTIHDSFFCETLGDKFGRTLPFPTKRPDTFYCHVGGYGKYFSACFLLKNY